MLLASAAFSTSGSLTCLTRPARNTGTWHDERRTRRQHSPAYQWSGAGSCHAASSVAWAVTHQTENHRQLAAFALCGALQHGLPACRVTQLRTALEEGWGTGCTRRKKHPQKSKPYFAPLWRHKLFLFFTVGGLPSTALRTILESLVTVAAACKDGSIKTCCKKQNNTHYLSASSSLTAAGSVANLLREGRVMAGGSDRSGAQFGQSTTNQGANGSLQALSMLQGMLGFRFQESDSRAQFSPLAAHVTQPQAFQPY